MGFFTTIDQAFQQAIPNNCTAKSFTPSQRLDLGVQGLANDADVSERIKHKTRYNVTIDTPKRI